MVFTRHKRQTGRWTALLAAYAFVLNALLATTLLAATPASKSLTGFELCLSTESSAHAVDPSDKATKRAAVHCQICLQNALPSALPPPAVSLPEIVGVVVPAIISRNDTPQLTTRFSFAHPPRGPPHVA